MNETFRKLRPDEIEVRVMSIGQRRTSDGVVNTAKLLLYMDARVPYDILDESVGPFGWSCSYSDDLRICTISIKEPDSNVHWVSKSNAGSSNDDKSLASDSFKRAAIVWGIGRELYSAGEMWTSVVKVTEYNGRKGTYDKFRVEGIEYDERGKISYIKVVNASQGGVLAYETPAPLRKKEKVKEPEEFPEDPFEAW